MKKGETLSGLLYCVEPDRDGFELEVDGEQLERLRRALETGLTARLKPLVYNKVLVVGRWVVFGLTREENFNEADMRTICYFLQAAGFGVEGKINIQAGLVIIDLI